MTIALSRVNASLGLDDIKDFYKVVNGKMAPREQDDSQLSMAGDDQQV